MKLFHVLRVEENKKNWKNVFIIIIILAMPYSMWDLNSFARDWSPAPCIGSMET